MNTQKTLVGAKKLNNRHVILKVLMFLSTYLGREQIQDQLPTVSFLFRSAPWKSLREYERGPQSTPPESGPVRAQALLREAFTASS